jgi:hypothetical protein
MSQDQQKVFEEHLTPELQILTLEKRLVETTEKLAASHKQLESKREECLDLKNAVKSTEHQHAEELELLKQEIEALKEDHKHSDTIRDEELGRLRHDMAHVEDVELENRKLRERVGLLMNELQKRGTDFAEETHRVKNDAFKLRVQLESTFRKTLQEMDVKYKDDAFNALGEDSKNALVENSKLERELTIQSIGIESLLKRYQKQLAAYRELKVENEVLVKKDKMQTTQLRELKRDRLAAEARVANLQDSMNLLNQAQLKVADLENKLEKSEEELHTIRGEHKITVEKVAKWKKRAFETSQIMLEQSSSRVIASQGSVDIAMPATGGASRPKMEAKTESEEEARGPQPNSRAMWNSQYSDASPVKNGPRGPITGLPMASSVNLHENMGPGSTTIVQSRMKHQGSKYRIQVENSKIFPKELRDRKKLRKATSELVLNNFK